MQRFRICYGAWTQVRFPNEPPSAKNPNCYPVGIFFTLSPCISRIFGLPLLSTQGPKSFVGKGLLANGLILNLLEHARPRIQVGIRVASDIYSLEDRGADGYELRQFSS